MAKIVRQTSLIFGSSAGLNQRAEFGSLAAGIPTFATTPNAIQALSNWLEGWFAAVLGENSPAIEDMNSFCFVMSYFISYFCQTGVAEWDSATIYFIGSVVNDGFGNLYTSITDNNQGNALSSGANWVAQGGTVQAAVSNANVQSGVSLVTTDTTAGTFTLTLPDATLSKGRTLYITQINESPNALTLAAVAGNISGQPTQSLPADAAVIVKSDGINWYIF